MLKINSLCVHLNSSFSLEDINFQVSEGQMCGIIGPNGAGKTTLLRAISGILPTSSGEIYFNEKPLHPLRAEERAKHLAVVPQAAFLPTSFTAKQVVMMGRTPYLNWFGQTSEVDVQITREAMDQTQTLDLADRLISQLSVGEQQRVLLARALAQDTPILLMDEPTSHLDLRYQIELLNLIQSITRDKQKIILVVLHDLNLALRYADQLLLLKNGEIIHQGYSQDVLRPEILSKVFELPVDIYFDKKRKIFYLGSNL